MNVNFVGQFLFENSVGHGLESTIGGEVRALQPINNGEEQRWNVFAWSDGLISLQNCHSEALLRAEPYGIICDFISPGPSERWVLAAVGDKLHVCLRGAHGSWLTTRSLEDPLKWGDAMAAERANSGSWEAFLMILSPHIQLHNHSWWGAVQNSIDTTDLAPIIISLGRLNEAKLPETL